MKEILNQIEESIELKKEILSNKRLLEQIERLAMEGLKSLRNGGKIILAGNGGSFADAQHISAEFTSRYMFDRDSLPSIALGTNSSAISAIGNDYGYENIFSRELSSIGNKDDLFIGISTSGNSNNIIKAVETSKSKGLITFCLTGGSGGKLDSLCECLKVPSSSTPRIQEIHIMIGHIVCSIIEEKYFKEERV